MATPSGNDLVRQLRTLMLHADEAEWSDDHLLHLFISQRDEAAFARIVHRYGPMVWGVCRRMLRDRLDVEDAFQATFLVLVRKASAIARRSLLANWLYGVAYKTALKARALRLRQQLRERQVTTMPQPEQRTTGEQEALERLLDQELNQLPEKYRVVILLCDLEGHTRKEAARQLGCPEGTVAGRLARARQLLAKRLARHGAILSASTLSAWTSTSLAAELPTSLVRTTITTGTALAAGKSITTVVTSAQVLSLLEGVLKNMLLTRLNASLAVLAVVTTLGLGVSGLLSGRADGEPVRDGEKVVADEQENKAETKSKKEARKELLRSLPPDHQEAIAIREALMSVHMTIKELEASLGKEAAFRAMEQIEEALRHTRESSLALGDRRAWTLGFEFKYPRRITLNVPGKGKSSFWYLCYYVTNPDHEPHVFVPDCELLVNGKLHPDGIFPSVQEAIRRIESPEDLYGLKNSVTVATRPIPSRGEKGGDKAVTCVAIWEDDFPEVEKMSILIKGLSNSFELKNNRIWRRTLQLNFKRDGDRMIAASPIEWQWITASNALQAEPSNR